MKRLIFLLITLVPMVSMAQEPFTADRPGATTGVDVLPAGRLQLETGLAWEDSRTDDTPRSTWTFNTSLLRFGISSFAELRMQVEYLWSDINHDSYNGFENIFLGTKVKMFEGWRFVPVVSLMGCVLVPSGNTDNHLPDEWGGKLGLLFQNEITPWFCLNYEGFLTWDDESRPTARYGICLSFELSKRLQLAVEQYNDDSPDEIERWSEIGLAWQVADRLQLDIATDINWQHPSRYLNAVVGVSWQITK